MRAIFFLCILTILVMTVSAQPQPGQPAPEISLPGIDGTIVHLSDLKGKVVLIDFWASWCGPCRQNNPHLVNLYKKFRSKGVEILGISLDNNDESWKRAVQQDQLEWIQVNDNKGWEAPSANAYDVNAIPASFLIDKKGNIRAVDQVGRALEAGIKKLLKE